MQRDNAAEESWCADFQALRLRIASRGGSVDIEQSKGVGVVPLREIESIELGVGGEAKRSRARERELPRSK